MPNLTAITHPADSFAEVRAHDQIMRYHRAGAGRPILILRSALEAQPFWAELDAALTSAFRVLTPDVPAAEVDVAAWMRGFLEGVGLDRVTIIAEGSLCIAALEMALLNSDQVQRLVLVPAGHTSETGLDGTLATSLAGVAVPLLVIRRGMASAEAVPLLMQFLEQRSTASATG
jgi:pimeloyl-ACP methyl ester carboxylesterase